MAPAQTSERAEESNEALECGHRIGSDPRTFSISQIR